MSAMEPTAICMQCRRENTDRRNHCQYCNSDEFGWSCHLCGRLVRFIKLRRLFAFGTAGAILAIPVAIAKFSVDISELGSTIVLGAFAGVFVAFVDWHTLRHMLLPVRLAKGRIALDRHVLSGLWGKEAFARSWAQLKEQRPVMGIVVVLMGGAVLVAAVDATSPNRTELWVLASTLLAIGLWMAWPQLTRLGTLSASRLRTPTVVASVSSMGAVVVGLTNVPYGYYVLLRLLLCGVSLFFLWGAQLRTEDWHRWALGGFAVLYNPIFPVRIGDRGIWEILNIGTVALFWIVSLRQQRLT